MEKDTNALRRSEHQLKPQAWKLVSIWPDRTSLDPLSFLWQILKVLFAGDEKFSFKTITEKEILGVWRSN
jgi:hypothetical protein